MSLPPLKKRSMPVSAGFFGNVLVDTAVERLHDRRVKDITGVLFNDESRFLQLKERFHHSRDVSRCYPCDLL